MIKQKTNAQFDQIKAEKEKEMEDLKQHEASAGRDIREIRAAFEKNKDKVVTLLMDTIMDVKLTLPKVVIGNFEEQDN